MREYPIKPLDHAVWWTEHIIKYGGNHLQSPAADVPWTEYYELKLIIMVLMILASILTVSVFIIRKIISIVFKPYKITTKLKSN